MRSGSSGGTWRPRRPSMPPPSRWKPEAPLDPEAPGGLVSERTLVLVKPDGVQRLLVGRILARYEERGLKLVALKLMSFDRDLAEFITSGPLVAAVLEGPNAIAIVRAMNGATRPHEAAPGSIRGDLAVETAQN